MINQNYSFSIVVPTRNRCHFLIKLLEALCKLDYPANKFEIIVVDNNSTDNTKKLVFSFINNYPHLIFRYHNIHRLGPSIARNAGINIAKHDNIIFIDDDVLIKKDLLEKYSDILKRYPDVSVIGGKIIAISDNKPKLDYFMNILEEDVWIFSHTQRKEKKLTFLNYPDDLVSANILINRSSIKGKVFNEDFGRRYGKRLIFSEDTELCLRLLLDNKKVIYDPTIVSEHIISDEKLNYKYIFNRFFRAGIEHKLLDKYFKKHGVRFYKLNLKYFILLITNYINKPTKTSFLKIVRELFFFVGYYYPRISD